MYTLDFSKAPTHDESIWLQYINPGWHCFGLGILFKSIPSIHECAHWILDVLEIMNFQIGLRPLQNSLDTMGFKLSLVHLDCWTWILDFIVHFYCRTWLFGVSPLGFLNSWCVGTFYDAREEMSHLIRRTSNETKTPPENIKQYFMTTANAIRTRASFLSTTDVIWPGNPG